MTINKLGFDLFEDGACLGGGLVREKGLARPRLPTVGTAEAYVLARRFEALAAVNEAKRSRRTGGDRDDS